jgi:cell migration-inducing and hyaluronan-binding protein
VPTTDPNQPKIDKKWSVEADWPEGKPTGDEEEVVILENWRVTLDEDTPLLKRLVVDGQIVFGTKAKPTTQRLLQDTQEEELLIRVKNLWIRKGSIVVGSATTPYTGKAAIELYGDLEDPYLLIDPFIEASNKVLAVTGSLNIYAPQPASVWTRLTVFAKAGDTTITVADATGWKAGD